MQDLCVKARGKQDRDRIVGRGEKGLRGAGVRERTAY